MIGPCGTPYCFLFARYVHEMLFIPLCLTLGNQFCDIMCKPFFYHYLLNNGATFEIFSESGNIPVL